MIRRPELRSHGIPGQRAEGTVTADGVAFGWRFGY